MNLTACMSKKQGNSLYWFADEIKANAMFTIQKDKSPEVTSRDMYDDCISIAQNFFALSQSVLWGFFRSYLNVDNEQLESVAIELKNIDLLSDVRFPFFLVDD